MDGKKHVFVGFDPTFPLMKVLDTNLGRSRAQGHFDTKMGAARNRTSALLIGGCPAAAESVSGDIRG